MKYQESALDELAAHYVLGTLRGRARTRMEQICRRDPLALRAVRKWEDRLSELNREIKSVQPPADVWRKILVKARRGSRNGIRRSWSRQMYFAAAAALAMLTLSIVQWPTYQESNLQLLATVIDKEKAVQLWRVERVTDGNELQLSASSTPLRLDPNYSYELWAISESGAAPPVSLGLMPFAGKHRAHLSPAQLRALEGARNVAVSQEPRGGSPTGAPTGPVLFVAPISQG